MSHFRGFKINSNFYYLLFLVIMWSISFWNLDKLTHLPPSIPSYLYHLISDYIILYHLISSIPSISSVLPLVCCPVLRSIPFRGQANKWIKKMEEPNTLAVKKFTDSDYIRRLEVGPGPGTWTWTACRLVESLDMATTLW